MRIGPAIVVLGWSAFAAAQENPFLTPAERSAESLLASAGPRLFDHEPYDLLFLNDKERTTLRIVPPQLADRRSPRDHDPKSLLRVKLFDRGGAVYDVAWGDITEIRPFEQLILDDASRLGHLGRFDEAFDCFIYLRREHSSLPGIEEAEISLNFAEADAALRDHHPDLAYARLLRLEQRAPRDPRLDDLAARATEQLVDLYLKSDRPRAARAVVERFAKTHAKQALTVAMTKQLSLTSTEQLASARKALDEGRFVLAQRAAQLAAALASDRSPALEIYRQAVAAYPAIVVGVVETAGATRRQPVSSWAERRTDRLRRIPTLELVVHTGEQPRAAYESGVNRWEANDRDPLAFLLRLGPPPAAPAAVDIAAALLSFNRGSKTSSSSPAPELRVIDRQNLQIRFARPYPRPEAIVAEALSSQYVGIDGATVSPADPSSPTDTIRYLRDGAKNKSGPREIVERRFADEEEATAALLAGDVDVVDRIAPWQSSRLRERRELQLVRYASPGVHLLLLNGDNPALANSELRRAIAYAIDREAILRNHLRPERDDLAARTIDGPFPMGRATDDPLGYAYDATGASRPYNPQRAFVLAATAGGGPSGIGSRARPLILAHPSTLAAGKACRRIAEYLAAIDVHVELRAAPPDQSPTTPDDADITYVVVSSVEPLVEVARWFGHGGLVNLDSRALDAAIAEVTNAESMTAARGALFDVQRVLHDESLIIPLWQYSEYAAQRSRLVRPANVAPTSLYQHVERWEVLPQFSEALP